MAEAPEQRDYDMEHDDSDSSDTDSEEEVDIDPKDMNRIMTMESDLEANPNAYDNHIQVALQTCARAE